MKRACSTHGKVGEVYTVFQSEDPKNKDHFGGY